MFKFFVFAHLLIVCAGATPVPAARPTQPPAFLPPPAQETMNFSVEGKLTKHTGTQLTINTEGNIIFRIVYNETTRIVRKNDSEGTPQGPCAGRAHSRERRPDRIRRNHRAENHDSIRICAKEALNTAPA